MPCSACFQYDGAIICAGHAERKPQRIVTIFSSNTEIVAILGLADNIAGIDAYTYFPDEIKINR